MNVFLITRLNSDDIVRALVDQRYKVLYCHRTNEQVLEAEARLEDLTRTRYVSKGRHLTEFVHDLGQTTFTIQYYTSKSPYRSGALDKATTLKNLQSALDAAGLQGSTASQVWEEEYDDWKSPPLHGEVLLFSNMALQALMTSDRPWWQWFGLGTGKYRDFERPDGKVVKIPIGYHRIALVFHEPDQRDFDRKRMVHADDVAELRAARRQGTNLPLHDIVDVGGLHYERRPHDLYFGRNLGKGFSKTTGAQPKLIISTQNAHVLREAYRDVGRHWPVVLWNAKRPEPMVVRPPGLYEQLLGKPFDEELPF